MAFDGTLTVGLYYVNLWMVKWVSFLVRLLLYPETRRYSRIYFPYQLSEITNKPLASLTTIPPSSPI